MKHGDFVFCINAAVRFQVSQNVYHLMPNRHEQKLLFSFLLWHSDSPCAISHSHEGLENKKQRNNLSVEHCAGENWLAMQLLDSSKLLGLGKLSQSQSSDWMRLICTGVSDICLLAIPLIFFNSVWGEHIWQQTSGVKWWECVWVKWWNAAEMESAYTRASSGSMRRVEEELRRMNFHCFEYSVLFHRGELNWNVESVS